MRIIILIIIQTVLACLLRTERHAFRHNAITHRARLLERTARIVDHRALVQLMIVSNDFEESRNLVERSVLGLRHPVIREGPEDGYKHGEWQK